MPHTTRTFVAIEVPPKIGEKLARLQSLLAPGLADVRFVTAQPFHVTLAFLGDVEDTDLHEVCRAVAAAAAESAPFEVRVEGVGVFPDAKRPRTVWAGLTGPGVDPLVALQARLAAALAEGDYPPDEKRFHPHVTLGRLKSGRRPPPDVTPLLNHYRTWSAGSFPVAEVVTFASTLTPDGPVYAPLGTAPLRGGNRRPSA